MRGGHGTHEGYDGHEEVKLPSERNFGFTVGLILIAIAAVRWFWFIHQGPVTLTMAAIGGLLVLLAASAPKTLALPNRLWMKLGLLLAMIVNPLIMGLMFLLIFTPVAIGMRLKGRDALRLRADRRHASTWVDRLPPGPAPESAVNQF
ncbi:SxtJ family membrane protein [Sphingomonas sp. C3-2]|uniref:SxtJ family membrane protein n=1 Tax=Sphingomonas sp. C3-2 TaxID=3062169 RepID=UPI00294B974F|nr:SxtJ family membrane protein [Sphingomonas sp. C3-2]WOK35943.1 SxtJ family membrane protein [Sphingomonas sp. C3-2]